MSKHGQLFYDFGPFRLDPQNYTLLREGQTVTLTRKALEMLIVLVENRGEVLGKEELLRRLWPDTTVEESNLTQNIYMIRQALGEAAHQQTYIETVPKRGYRFVAEVTEVSNGYYPTALAVEDGRAAADAAGPEEITTPAAVDESQEVATATVAAVPEAGATTPAPAPARRWRAESVLLVALTLALGAVLVVVYFWKIRGPRPVSREARVIAVLPLKPIGPDGEMTHLGLGMTDAMITKLSNLQQISVRPTSAIFKYTAAEYDPVQAGRELGVDAVLEGSVQRAGDNVRVTVRLLSIPDGQPLWGEIYNKKATDVFAVQDAISEEVAQALKLKLTSAERTQLAKHYTQNPEAYQAYARGLYFWNLRTEDGFRQSVKHYEEAIAKDPAYALAYAGLADTYGLVAYYRYERVAPREEALGRARELAARAIQLDDSVAEAHAAAGLVKSLDRDIEGAVEGYKRAIALNPNYATARQRHALTLLTGGRLEEATAEMRRAQEIDPLSVVININLAQMYYFGRDYERAATLCQKTLETTNAGINQLLLLNLLANTRVQQGRREEARELFQRALEQNDEFDEAREGLAYTAALAGEREEALKYVPRFRSLTGQYSQAYLSLALVHSALGDTDEAFRNLDAYTRGMSYPSATLRYDPRLDPLRKDPRFADLLKRRFGTSF